jgi:hypothetical protein
MRRELSFGARLDQGWPRAQLQDHYCMSDNDFDRVVSCLESIRKGVRK